MSVFHRFRPEDLLWSTVYCQPRTLLASGTAGWRGNQGTSSSLSLYGGIRARGDVGPGSTSGLSVYPVDPQDTLSIDRIRYVSGSYPSTGSVFFVKARNTDIFPIPGGNQLETSADWYQRHLQPVLNLFDYYSRLNPEYTTASYDNYSLFFSGSNTGSYVAFTTGGLQDFVTASFTLMARIKPLSVQTSNQTIIACQCSVIGQFIDRPYLLLRASTNQICVRYSTTAPNAFPSSSAAIPTGTWSTIAFTAGDGSASFYINGQLDSTFAFTRQASGSLMGVVVGATVFSATINQPFRGYIKETRVYNRKLTAAEISSSYASRYYQSGSDPNLIHYARYNDGPLGIVSGCAQGSGVLEYYNWPRNNPAPSSFGRGAFNAPLAGNPFSLVVPMWQPNDDPLYVTTKDIAQGTPGVFKILHVPTMFYGRQIATGSVKLVCNAYRGKGIERVVIDDGRGRLYVSGSMTKPLSGEDYGGVGWNKVGNVFYSEGFIVLTDPSMLDFGETGIDASPSFPDTLSVSFAGVQKVFTKVFHCRLDGSEANASNNRTFSKIIDDPNSQHNGRRVVKNSGETRISTVCLYDSHRRLVAVAKLADPIRKRPGDRLMIRLKYDL